MQEIRTNPVVERGREAMQVEAAAIKAASKRLNGDFSRAVGLLAAHSGKIIVSGMGKSGHIAQKMAATFSGTGAPAIFLHPADAAHGDLGVYTPGDPTILVSKSGATVELLRLIPILREFQSPLIAIVGNLNSTLAREADAILDACVQREADPLNLAPTASAAVALALGDALAAALMTVHGFRVEDFARLHPQGHLGRTLWLHVADVMHASEKTARVRAAASLKDVVIAMTQFPLGAACVVDSNSRLLGIVTDGDVRRALQQHDDIRALTAVQIMVSHPVTIEAGELLAVAVDRMEKRSSQISVLPVVGRGGQYLGLVRIHDIYQADL